MVVLQDLFAALTAVQTTILNRAITIFNEMRKIAQQLEQGRTLFSRRGKLVAANNNYVLVQITIKQIEKYLQQVNPFLEQVKI